jgi:hypothetical protein
MKTGRSLQELAAEVERQAEAKQDYVASTRDMHVVVAETDDKPVVKLELGGKSGELLDIGQTAHDQIAAQAEIPAVYYRKMLAEQPRLLAQNVNTWFAEKPQKRMLRTMDRKARALLSDKYRALDNWDFLQAALPAIMGKEIVSCEITERRLFVKVVDPAIQRHIPNGFRMGDGSHKSFKVPNGEVIPAGSFGNSEIGYGSLYAEGGWLDKGCTNLAWGFKARSLKKVHVGQRLEIGDDLYRLVTDETREATDKALWLQFRDAVGAAMSEKGFDDLVGTLTEAAQDKIEGDPIKVVEVAAKRFSLSDDTRSNVLKYLIEGGDLSKFGLANAVTSAANNTVDYEVATDLEKLGGQIIALPKTAWGQLSRGKVIDADFREVKDAA